MRRRTFYNCLYPRSAFCYIYVVFLWINAEIHLHRGAIDTLLVRNMKDVFGCVLGPREARDAERARKVGTTFCGGIPFEHSEHAISVNDASPRCYTLAQSYQHSRLLVGPTMGTKVYGVETEHHKLRRSILKVKRHFAHLKHCTY